jgi:hypothetical protein
MTKGELRRGTRPQQIIGGAFTDAELLLLFANEKVQTSFSSMMTEEDALALIDLATWILMNPPNLAKLGHDKNSVINRRSGAVE